MTDLHSLADIPQSESRAAAESVVECMQTLANRGKNVVTEVLAGRAAICDEHYPPGDEIDSNSGYRYYYHTHDNRGWQKREHGHFHLFQENTARFHHMIALSVNEHGLPVRLFTTNRWVTGERWAAANSVCQEARNFHIDESGPFATLNRWLNAMTKLYRPLILQLLHARDARVQTAVQQGRDRERFLDDRRIHVLSQSPISLMERLDAVS